MAHEFHIDDLDLLAYADGMLDTDPQRKAQVEAHLRANPKTAAYVAELVAQTHALRAAYGPRLSEPVPARLHAALAERSRDAVQPLAAGLRAAAILALMAAAGLTGFMLGQATAPTHFAVDDAQRPIQSETILEAPSDGPAPQAISVAPPDLDIKTESGTDGPDEATALLPIAPEPPAVQNSH
jgi:anti-sigma factor RsiW